MELVVLLIVFLIILSYFRSIQKLKYWRKRGIPNDTPVPYIGNSLSLLKHSLGTYLKEMYEKYDSPMIGTFLFEQPQLIVKDPKIINSILVEDFQNFSDRMAGANVAVDPVAYQMLSMIKNPEWKELRHKMSVAFSSGKMKLMFPLMKEVSNDLLVYMKKNDKFPIHGKDICTRYMTDVIASCAFGVKAFSFSHEDSDIRIASQKMFELTFMRIVYTTCFFVSPFLVNFFKMKFLETRSCELMKNLFWQMVKQRRQTLAKRNDLVDILMAIQDSDAEDGKIKFDGDIVVAQAIQFFLAGFETSGSTTSFAMYELSLHQDMQNKLRNEISTVVAKNNGVSYDAVLEMKYLDMVIHEALRKYPIIPFLNRLARDNYRIPGTEYTIEEGTTVFVPVLGLHYDATYYPEPEKFDPERFTAENKAARPSCSYLSFGYGPRNCIGARFALMSIKLFLISVLTEYEIFKSDDTPSCIRIYPRGFTLTPDVPLKFVFKRINAS